MAQQAFYLLFLALLIINAAGFAAVGLDKKKSVQGGERYSEVSFFLWAVFFGSLGVFLGMFAFRHKTRKIYFPLGIGLLLLEQIALLMLARQVFLIF